MLTFCLYAEISVVYVTLPTRYEVVLNVVVGQHHDRGPR